MHRQILNRSPLSRAAAFFLAIIMFIAGINLHASAGVVEDKSVRYNEWTFNTCWRMLSHETDMYNVDRVANEDDELEAIIEFNYHVEQAGREYLPGEISVTFTGLSELRRGEATEVDLIGSEDKDWEVTTDEATDTYTFTNRKIIEENSIQDGGFNTIWYFNSREGTNGYTKNIKPYVTVRDSRMGTEERIMLEELNYRYTSVKDDISLVFEKDYITPEYYDYANRHYVWYDYKTTIYSDKNARGLNKSSYFIRVDVPEGVDPADVVVIRENGTSQHLEEHTVRGMQMWGYYEYSTRYGDYFVYLRDNEDKYYYEIKMKLGFPQFTTGYYADIYTYLDRLYQDETEYELVPYSEDPDCSWHLKQYVRPYYYDFGGFGISSEKWNDYERHEYYARHLPPVVELNRLVANKLFETTTIEFTIDAYCSRKYGGSPSSSSSAGFGGLTANAAGLYDEDLEYSFIVGDDRLAVHLNDRSARQLMDHEYNMTYLRLPAVEGRDCPYRVFVADHVNARWDEYTELTSAAGNLSAEKMVYLTGNVKAFYIYIEGIQESINYRPKVGIEFHLDIDEELAKPEEKRINTEQYIINYTFTRFFYVDENDGLLKEHFNWNQASYGQYDPIMETFSEFLKVLGDKTMYEMDTELYGQGIARGYSRVWLRNPAITLHSDTDVDVTRSGNSKIGYDMKIYSNGYLVSDTDGELKKFSLYSVIPEYFSINPELPSLAMTGSATDRTGKAVTTADFEDRVSYDIKKTPSGKTIVCANFDFSDRPLEISEYTRMSIEYDCYITSRHFEESDIKTFRITTLTSIRDSVVSKILTTYDNSLTYFNEYDIDGDGKFDKLMSSRTYPLRLRSIASAWLNMAQLFVSTVDSGGFVEQSSVTAYNPYVEADSEINAQSYYTYRLGTKLRNISADKLVIYNNIETYVDDDDESIRSEWHGDALRLDTEYLESKGFIVNVYYSSSESSDTLGDGSWTRLDESQKNGHVWTLPGGVRSVSVELDTSNFENGIYIVEATTTAELYYLLYMRAPSDGGGQAGKYAYNQNKAYYHVPNNPADVYVKYASEYTSLELDNKFTIEKVDSENPSFKLTGATFRIYDSGRNLIEEVTTNRFGRAEVKNLEFGKSYYYQEISTPKGYQRSTELVPFTFERANYLLIVSNTPMKGKVTFTKYDMDSYDRKVLQGAKYELYRADGTQLFTDSSHKYSESGTVGVFTTDEQGHIEITELPMGQYYFLEKEAPSGYLVNPRKAEFSIDRSLDTGEPDLSTLVTTAEQGDPEKTASLYFTKTDQETGLPLRSALYALYRYNEAENQWQEYRSGFMTNVVGEIVVSNLKFGRYKFVEKNPPAGYQITSVTVPEEIVLNEETALYDEDTAFARLMTRQSDPRKTGTATLTKYGEDGKTPLAGARFSLYRVNPDGDDVIVRENLVTGPDGRIIADSSQPEKTDDGKINPARFTVTGLKWGDYYFVEDIAPRGYEKSSEKKSFTIDRYTVDETKTLIMSDTRRKGSVKLIKTALEDGNGYSAGDPLEGAEFELYRVSDDGSTAKVGGTYTSDASGIIEVNNLDWGSYYFREIKAPAGFGLARDSRFAVNASTCMTVQELVSEDPLLTCTIKIDKQIDDRVEAFGNPTFIFRITELDGSGNKTNNYYTASVIMAGGEKNGSAVVNVSPGTYLIEEESVSRYALSSARIVAAGTTTSVYTPLAADDDPLRVTCTLSSQADGTPDSFEVEFINDMDEYSKTSHKSVSRNVLSKSLKITGLSVDYPSLVPIDPNGGEDSTFTLDRSILKAKLIYEDGSERDVDDITQVIPADGSSDFIVHNSINYSGNTTVMEAQYTTAGGKVLKAPFDVTVEVFNPSLYRKITFRVNDSDGAYIGTAGTLSNVVYYDSSNHAVMGEYIVPESFTKVFYGWCYPGDMDNIVASNEDDFAELPDGTVLVGRFGLVISQDFSFNGGVWKEKSSRLYLDNPGTVQEYTIPVSGKYKLEVWGAKGGNDSAVGGNGGYSVGTKYFTAGTVLYVYVGGLGATNAGYTTGGGWNGGGHAGYSPYSGGGGGATDIRLIKDPTDDKSWDDTESLNSRIIVAGGGGGGGNGSKGGHGGGLTGGDGQNQAGKGATQTSGYMLGRGQDRGSGDGGGAGGGYWGGTAPNSDRGGGGGSGYIEGLDDAQTIGGNEAMPTFDSTEDDPKTMTGNANNGYARISFVGG